jgi:hypothetical protein
VTLGTVVTFVTIVAIFMPLVALVMPFPVMVSTFVSICTLAQTQDWMDFHEIWYGRYAIGKYSKLILFSSVFSVILTGTNGGPRDDTLITAQENQIF